MKKGRLFPLFLALALVISLFRVSGLSLPVEAVDIPDAGVPDQNSLVLNKTATANTDGTYTITLEAYATGSKIVSSVNKDVPTDIVLVIDQSGSMANCIVCGKEIDNNKQTHSIYSEVTTIDTNKTYYVLETNWQGSTSYQMVRYCNGTHKSNVGDPGGSGGTTSCRGGAGWYTSSIAIDHTTQNKYTPKTESNPNGTQFYEAKAETCTSRLSSLKTAVTTFVGSVNTKAKGADGVYGTDDDVNHRIAMVGFATGDYSENSKYPTYENTELFIGATQYNYNENASSYYGSAFQNMNTEAGYNNIIDSKNALAARGATHVDLGIEMANGIFNANPIAANEERNRVMIVFTDGSPSYWDTYSGTVASNGVSKAYTTKNTHKASVYTVGIFSGANGSPVYNWSGVEDANKFMHLVSSNFKNAQNMDAGANTNTYPTDGSSYYLSAGDSDSLNNIFQQIADQIESGGSSTTLDSSAVIKDIIAPQFQLPEGATAGNITLQTATCTGIGSDNEYTWSTPTTATGVTETISRDNVDVTGFDFSKNWVGTETNNGSTTYRGSKLIISFKVETKDGFLGGNDVFTNTSAGVYKDASATTPEFIFNRPTVNVPIGDVTVTAADINVYLLGELTAEQIKEDATVSCGGVDLDLSKDDYGLESWQTDYVNIEVTYTDKDGNTVTDLSNLDADTTYTVTAIVTPKTDGSTTDQGTVATEKTGNKEGKINVFKPKLTYKDSDVYYGDNVPTSYESNLTKTEWKHGETKSTDSGITMIGTEPTLTLDYTPDATKISGGKINSKQDIPVDVTVKIGTTDVTDKTGFVHTKCNDNETDPTDGKFWLHVKTCSLTITKAAGENTTIGGDEYFVFNVKKDGADYTQVTIQGTGSVEIKELPVGTYTVKEDASTAWRYTPSITGSGNLSATNPTGSFTCTNTIKDNKWLNHFNRVINTFGVKPEN